MKYICKLCNKEFKQKCHYDAHCNRKFTCVKNIDVINNSANLPPNSADLPPNSADLPPNSADLPPKININNISNLTCKYCNKIYTRKDVLLRHINERCKIKKIYDNKNIEETNKLIEENKKINDQLIEQSKKINELKEELKQLSICQVSKIKSSKNININNSHNTINNTNINNTNIQNNNNNNFIVNFGSEDMSKLTDTEILRSLKALSSVFTSFIKTVHANKRLPEFSNLHITNLRSNHGLMMEDGIFVSKTYLQIIEELIITRLPDLEYFANKFKDNKKLTQREYNSITRSLEFLKNSYIETEDVDGNKVKGNKDVVKKLKQHHNDIITTLYDNREIINNNINSCKENKCVEINQIKLN
jgi:hypothetical protein